MSSFPAHLQEHILLLFPGQIPRYLSEKNVSAAFKEQALVWHPDRAPTDTSDAMLGMMVRRMTALNNAKDILDEAMSDASWQHSAPPAGGQQGSDPARPPGVFTIRAKWFEGTISGLKRGELTLRSVEDQLLEKCEELQREVEAYVIGLEKHQSPADPNYDEHIHFALKVKSRFYHNSSKWRQFKSHRGACLSRVLICTGHFDLRGSSTATLRTHITLIEDDNDFKNKCRYSSP
jgi:hypothetical protein